MKKYFKKGLSVFLSLLMVFTSLVFVVPEMTAEAATAGTYKIAFCVYDNDNGSNGLNDLVIKYKTKANNGTGTESSEQTVTVDVSAAATAVATGNNYYVVNVNSKDFPSYFYAYGACANLQYPELRLKVMVAKAGTADYYQGTTSTAWKQVADFEFFHKDFGGSNSGSATTTSISNTPYASSVSFVSGSTSITLPKTGATNKTNTYVAGVYDQYGVRMSYDPTYYLRTSAPTSATTSNSSVTGVSINSTTGVLTTTSSAQMSGTTDSKTVYIHAVYGTMHANRTVTLNDPTYTYTLDANGGSLSDTAATTSKQYGNTFGSTPNAVRTGFSLKGFYTTKYDDSYATNNVPTTETALATGTTMVSDLTWYAAWQASLYQASFTYRNSNAETVTESSSVYYGLPVTAPAFDSAVTTADGDWTYTFTHWQNGDLTYTADETLPVMDIANVSYTAVYDEQYNVADYTEVNKAIAAAEDIMADDEYEVMYTEASRATLTQALAAVTENLGVSKQSTVDGYAEAINNAIDGIEKNKYVVLFLDDDGMIIKDGYHFVEYGDSVEVPATPEKDYDSDKHYTFIAWDEDTSACTYVTDDLVFTAEFKGTNHIYSTSTVESTCTTDGSTLYDCTGCDYSYTAANGDTAHHTWEDEKRVILDATCGTAGLKATYCSVCGAIDENSFETYTEESEHSWGEEVTLVEESCTGSGIYTKTCQVCNKTEYIFVEPSGHTWESKPTVVAPTCMSAGYTITRCTTCWFASFSTQTSVASNHLISTTTLDATCSTAGYVRETCAYNCGYSKETASPATGKHTIPEEWTTISEATCSNYGVKMKECSVCHQAKEYQSIEPTGIHSYGDWVTVEKAGCGTNGLEKRTCTNCGIASESRLTDALEHNWAEYPAGSKAANCTETGIAAELCGNCYSVKETLTSKLGHNYEKTAETSASCTAAPTETWTCKNDASHAYTLITGVPNEHNYGTGTIVTQATCTTPQVSLYICADCGDEYELATAVPNGHSYIDNWQVITQATETENGQMVRYCTACNTAPEYATIPATGEHLFVEGDYVAPTCEATGSQAYVCTTHENCEANYVETIPATGHELTLDTKDASCTETGYVKVICDVETCGKEINSYEIPMLSHSYAEVEGTRIEATCTEPGSYTTKCGGCGDEQAVSIPATGHAYTTEDVAATCISGAKTVYTCDCGYSYAITTSDPLEHQWTEWKEVIPATADTAGVQRRECACVDCNCGKYEEAPIPPNGGHTFMKDNDASVDATCDTAGKIVYKCTDEHNCGVTYSYDVAATGHKLKLQFMQATCTEDGYANVYCSSCLTYIEKNTINKLGHKYTSEVTTAAKCGEAGEITYTCENCGDAYTEAVAALEHNYIIEVAGTKVEPTCIVDGKVTMKCFNCDETKEVVLSKTGHDYSGEGKVIVAPDCVTAGKIEYTCAYDYTHKMTIVTDPTGAHTFVGDAVPYAATCETDARQEQYCEACRNWVASWEAETALGHDWSEWVVEKLPTETEDGYQHRTCQREKCGKKEEMTLTAGRMFLITFYNDNGVRLTVPTEYTYGSKVVRPEDPIKHEDDVYTYKFVGWKYRDYEFSEVEKMIDYLGYGWDFSKEPGDDGYEAQEAYMKEMALIAVYEKVDKKYSVTYIVEGNEYSFPEDLTYSEIYTAYEAAYGGAPEKEETEVYTYTFKEWQVVCTKDKNTGEYYATATAVFNSELKPGQTVEEEPTMFMKFFQSLIDFFKNLFSKIGINL